MSKKILVVEDNRHNLELIRVVLEMKGYEVLEAEDGKRAMEILSKSTVDVILLDLQLPGISGYEVAEWIKNQEKLRDIPLIAVTAYATSEEEEKAKRVGCWGYITKPINTRTLDKEIERIIENYGKK